MPRIAACSPTVVVTMRVMASAASPKTLTTALHSSTRRMTGRRVALGGVGPCGCWKDITWCQSPDVPGAPLPAEEPGRELLGGVGWKAMGLRLPGHERLPLMP